MAAIDDLRAAWAYKALGLALWVAPHELRLGLARALAPYLAVETDRVRRK